MSTRSTLKVLFLRLVPKHSCFLSFLQIAIMMPLRWLEDGRVSCSRNTNMELFYFCSDDAGQCARARRILSLRYPYIIWTRCWAHQINLMVKALLKSSSFKEVSEQAIAAAKAINASSSKFSPKLKTMCADMYGNKSPTTILTVGETRWNSTQGCFAS